MSACQDVYDILLKKFQEKYGRKPEVVAYAPGRVEILGNHTDYNEGYVLSAAINFGTYFAVASREGLESRLCAGDVMEEVSFNADQPSATKDHMWSNYVKGVLAGINAIQKPTHGFDAMFLGNIPLGSGLSSSAALEVAAGLAFSKLYGAVLSNLELARIGQKAEHDFAGVKCGLLDQFSSKKGKKGSLVWSDFRTYDVKPVTIGEDVCFLMCNTNARHALVDGAYNERRQRCEQAAAFFATRLDHKVAALRDVSWEEWLKYHGEMDPITAKRSAHPIGEDERVLSGIEMLRNNNLAGFGRLMFESHDSSRNYFENSCPELDTLVDGAQAIPGVLGARLSGGGFGGSVVVMVNKTDVEAASVALRNVYANKHGSRCDTRIITCSDGARVVIG